jgi:hypothetical protein
MSRKARLYLLRDKLIERARDAPNTVSKSRGIAKRFEEHAKEYFTFIDVDYVSPSNNFAEISVRGFVIDRKIRYFSQSMLGIYVVEALRSILDTLKLKGMDKKKFLVEALTAASKREPLPSLAYPGQEVD